jgi:PleD family two-component response regulator
VGVFVLVKKLLGKDLQNISEQTTKLAQKGLTDDITGLVGNARSLIDALNELVKTAAGVGILLLLIGIALIGAAYAIVLQIR